MKNGQIVVIVGFLIVIGLIGLSFFKQEAPAPLPPVDNELQSNAAAVIEAASSNGESMWLLFRSTTCAPCIEMQKIFDELKPEYKDKVHFIAIDVNDENNIDLLRSWQIRYIPTTFIVDGNGEISYQNVGTIAAAELRDELNKVVKESGSVD